MPKTLGEFSAADWRRLRPLTQGVKTLRYRLVDRRYRRSGAVAGNCAATARAIRGRKALVTIAFSDPQLLAWQTRLLRRYVPHAVHVIVDNSPGNAVAGQNARIAAAADVAYLRAPPNPWPVDAASRSHGLVLNWTWDNVIRPGEPEAFGFIDHDIFPTAADDPFAPLAAQDVYGVIRTEGKRWFLWAGFCMYRFAAVRDRPLDFGQDWFMGLDTGGGNWTALYCRLDRTKLCEPPTRFVAFRPGIAVAEGPLQWSGTWLHEVGRMGDPRLHAEKRAVVAELLAPHLEAADAVPRPPRIVFDLTTSAMWSGPPAGIARVESEFGSWALGHIAGVVPAFFDPHSRAFRHLDPEMATRLIAQDAAIASLAFVGPARRGKRKTDRIPASVRPTAMWVLQTRRMALQALEGMRLASGRPRTTSIIDRLQRAIMNARHRAVMIKDDGTRRACLPIDMVAGPEIDLAAGDTLICAGAGWVHNDIAAIAALKRAVGFRFVLFCYDIIPLMFPHYFMPADAAAHRAYCQLAFPAADLVVFSSRTVEADVRAYCTAQRLALRATAVCDLGADVAAASPAMPLPPGLEKERYALLVSTIEPRKGHRLIYDAWLRLLAAGIPQRQRFKLVFAGREGWLVSDLMRDLRSDPRVAGTLLVITGAEDAELATLYRNAAFCLYPSRYEGYGLPVVEALRHGKAMLASTGGAVPETVGAFSPCLDPTDAEAWRMMLQTWIEDRTARAPYEERIRAGFRHPNWDESARKFFALVNNKQCSSDRDADPAEAGS